MATMKSLQDIGAVQLAIQICNLPDVQKEIVAVQYHTHRKFKTHNYDKYEMLIKKAAMLTEELGLPVQLKERTLTFVVPIGIRILNWVKYHERKFDLPKSYIFSFLNSSHFHSYGLIDEKKISEEILKDKKLDMKKRLKIACFYCQKDDIISLYREMSQTHWKIFYDADYPNETNLFGLVKFWSYYLQRKIDKLRGNLDINVYGLEVAIKAGSKIAVEHFWKNLSAERKNKLVIGITRYTVSIGSGLFSAPDSFKDIFFFLFSQMEQGQQIEFFRKYFAQDSYYDSLLRWFLDWPYQDHFMKTIRLVWDIIPKKVYSNMLVEISDIVRFQNNTPNFKRGDEDTYDYVKVLKEFWSESSDFLKRFSFGDDDMMWSDLDETDYVAHLFFNLFSSENCPEHNDIIETIFSSATSEEKKNLILSSRGKSVCSILGKRQQLETLDEFLMKCLSCEEKVRKFKRNFKFTNGDLVCAHFVGNENYDAVVFFMKWAVSTEEEMIKLKERVCSSSCVKHAFVNLVLLKERVEIVNRFLNWFVPSEKITNYKRELIFNNGLEYEFSSLAEKDKFECIEIFLEWACANYAEEGVEVKKAIAFTMGSKICESLIFDCKWETIEKFLTWCFQSEEEINEFKKNTLFLESRSEIYQHLIAINKKIQAQIFCEWLGLSAEEITQLENETDSNLAPLPRLME